MLYTMLAGPMLAYLREALLMVLRNAQWVWTWVQAREHQLNELTDVSVLGLR